jgi:hypothetical protein
MTRDEAVQHLRFHINARDGLDPTRLAQVLGVIDDLGWDGDDTFFIDETTAHDLAELIEEIRPFLPQNIQNRIRNRNLHDLWDWLENG